jgi:hypothetical protein
MTLEKLQYIATAVVSTSFKARWMKWWNSSIHICEALHFPPKGFTDKDLEPWLNEASYILGKVVTSLHSFVGWTSLKCLSLYIFNLDTSSTMQFSIASRRGSNCFIREDLLRGWFAIERGV